MVNLNLLSWSRSDATTRVPVGVVRLATFTFFFAALSMSSLLPFYFNFTSLYSKLYIFASLLIHKETMVETISLHGKEIIFLGPLSENEDYYREKIFIKFAEAGFQILPDALSLLAQYKGNTGIDKLIKKVGRLQPSVFCVTVQHLQDCVDI